MENISVVDQEIDQRGIDSSKKGDMAKIGLNGLLFATFFLPWVKASNELVSILGIFNLDGVEEYMSISPYKLIETLRTLSKFMDGDIGELAVLYAYVLIPIATVISCIAILFIRRKSISINLASSFLVLVIALITYNRLQAIEDVQHVMEFAYGYYAVYVIALANIGLELFYPDKPKMNI